MPAPGRTRIPAPEATTTYVTKHRIRSYSRAVPSAAAYKSAQERSPERVSAGSGESFMVSPKESKLRGSGHDSGHLHYTCVMSRTGDLNTPPQPQDALEAARRARGIWNITSSSDEHVHNELAKVSETNRRQSLNEEVGMVLGGGNLGHLDSDPRPGARDG